MAQPKILLVDDTSLFLTLEKELLKYSPAQILTATNGREAYDLVRELRPDLIYMDLDMPEMDGAACCAAIKSHPDLSATPVIIVTTSDTEEDRRRCAEAGCDGYLIKPFDKHKFLAFGRKLIPTIDLREPRRVWRAVVTFSLRNELLTGRSEDLSLNGIYVVSPKPGRVDEEVELKVALDDAATEWIEAWGKIAWSNPPDAPTKRDFPHGFGVHFLAMTEDHRLRLGMLLRSMAL